MSLRSALIRRISKGGPIPFEDFMAAALYDPAGGFFTSRSLRSVKDGDFLTSPEVSPLFGQTLAKFVDDELLAVSDRGAVLVEVGAGSGSLLGPLLATLATPVEAWAVEASPAARQALRGVLPPDRVTDSLDRLPGRFSGVVIANELVDNLPVALAVRKGEGWEERWVGVRGGTLVLVPVEARPEVADWADRFGLPAPEGGLVEVQLAAGEWLRSVLERLAAGAVLVIDYGDTAENLERRRVDGTLRTYRAHHLGPDPLDEPGETDITVDVNFSALIALAEQTGAAVEYDRQEGLLGALGLRERLRQLRYRELALARDGDPMERLKIRSLRTEAETLLHPRGLGDFRVLVVRRGQTLA